jgi:hypothetical protein
MPATAHQTYVGPDLHIAGPYAAVRVAMTTNVALATAVEDGDTLDGVVLNSADDVGLFGQTDPAENGVYTVAASGAPTRATWFNSNATMRRDLPILVREGTLAGHVFVHATETTPIVPGTTGLVFVDTTGGGGAGVTYGTPSLTLGAANAAGSTDEAIRRDATILAFDGTSPSTQAFGDAAAAGAATVAARRDHKHAMPANPVTAHEAAGDPHPGYLTAAEGNAAYESAGAVAAHTGDTSDAHDASAISFTPAGTIAATTVQAAIEEVAAEAGGGGMTGFTVEGDATGPFAVEDGDLLGVYGADGLSVTVTDDAGGPFMDLALDINGMAADASPDGAADYVATWDASAGAHKKVLLDDLPGGGGGVSHTYLGYNTIGGSTEAATAFRWYMKKITVASDGLLASVGAYLRNAANGNTPTVLFAVWEDNAGDPRYLFAASSPLVILPDHANDASAGTARWFHQAMGLWVPAGDYWIGVQASAATLVLTKDGSGADRYYTTTYSGAEDAGYRTVTTTTDRYSLRASLVN